MAPKKAEENSILSINRASEILGICPATLKNWIKLGKINALKQGRSYILSDEDVRHCQKSLESSDMLRRRRNKRLSDTNFIPRSYIDSASPNYRTIIDIATAAKVSASRTEDILMFYASLLLSKSGISDETIRRLTGDSITKNTDIDPVFAFDLTPVPLEDTLGMLYLSLRGLREKKATGSYYTPFFAADKLCETALSGTGDLEGKSFCDPACGTGNFLIRLPMSVRPSDIYGIDIDKLAVSIARINLAIRHHLDDPKDIDILFRNLISADFLSDKIKQHFDIIIGNPPWGASFSPAQSKQLKKAYYCAKGIGRPESFSLFIEKALSLSESVVFLVPETILESGTHTAIREFILEKGSVGALLYLGEIFDKVQCPCIILKTASGTKDTAVNVSFYKRSKKDLFLQKSFCAASDRLSSQSFQLIADDKQNAVIQKMNGCKHFTLKGNADFALGIVSGNNRSLLTDEKLPSYEGIIKGTDIEKYSLKEPTSFVHYEENSFQQIAPLKYYRNSDKLFYKFIAPEPVIAHDSNGYLSLNSANIIIPTLEDYSSFYIMAVLNSSCISFYYRNTCRNMKVLRARLEQLPIPCCSASKMQAVSDMARAVSAGDLDKKELDLEIAGLFGLSDEEFKAISHDC